MKEEGLSDGEDDVSTDALVEEMLQQGDTAVIYPEAPEDEPQCQGTPDASIHDENGNIIIRNDALCMNHFKGHLYSRYVDNDTIYRQL